MRAFVLLTALLLAGCKGQCRQLSERLCDCALNSSEKTACLSRASNSEGVNPPTEADEANCKTMLNSCDCRLINTPDGKVRCGLARAPQ